MWTDLGVGILEEFVSAESMRPPPEYAKMDWAWKGGPTRRDPVLTRIRKANYREPQRQMSAAWRAKNLARVHANGAAWRSKPENQERQRQYSAAYRAKRKAAQCPTVPPVS